MSKIKSFLQNVKEKLCSKLEDLSKTVINMLFTDRRTDTGLSRKTKL